MEIVCGTVDNVSLDTTEVCRRLQVLRGFTSDAAEDCLKRLQAVAVYRYAYVRVPVAVSDGCCRFDFGEVPSADLSKNLTRKGGTCTEAFLLGVTLGMGVERLLMRLRTSVGEHFITDALASAMAESLCDTVNEGLAEQAALIPRFSPGYGDVPLWVQKPLLTRLQADKTLGILLNDAYLMMPTKSITAIVGIE